MVIKTNVKKWLYLHWKTLAVLGAYVVLTLVMTWPLAGQLGMHLPGRGDDLLVRYWNRWWIKRVLTQGGDLFYTDMIFYPTGVNLLYHNIAWANIALWLPLQSLIGGIVAFNLIYLLNLFLCAVGMYVLARHLTLSTAAAFVAGLVYAFFPYRLFEIDHSNLIAVQWLPLFLLYLMRVVREECKFRHATLAALFLALTGYTRWQLLVFVAIVAGLYVVYSLVFERRRWNWRVVLALGMMGIISLALMTPALYPLVRAQLTRQHPEDLFVPSLISKQTDLLAYVVVPHNHLLDGLFDGLLYADSYTRAWYSNAYLGYFVILLVILGVCRTRRMRWFWVGLGLVAWLLAMGPSVRFNKQIYESLSLPYVLVKDFLPVKIMREERRFNILLALPVAAMAAYGVVFLQDWARRHNVAPRYKSILFAALVLLLCLDYLQIPVQTFDTEISPFYQSLAREPGRFALLNLPTGRDRSPFLMLCQTTHGKPIVEGSIARPPREARAFVEDNPFLLYLRDTRKMNPDLPDVSRQLGILAEAGVRYVILNEQYAFPWDKENWHAYLAFRPFYEDEFIEVYHTDLKAGRDFDVSHELLDGIGLTQVVSATDSIAPGSTMEVAVVWGTTATQREDFAVELALVNEAGQTQQRATFPPVAGWPTGEWPASALGHGRYAFKVDPRLPSSTYTLTLSLVEEDTLEQLGETVVIGDGLEMPIPPRVFTPPAMQTEMDAAFGDDLSLLGYDLDPGTDALRVTLHWQALRRMDRSYKFFLHLYDAENDELAAQVDVVPRNWTYVTIWWEVGEIVSDEVRLPLEGVEPGRYWLAVGVYHPETGDRLSVSSGTLAVLSDALILQEVTVP
jgi:hypothetical protein